MDTEGKIYRADTEQFLIKILEPNGDYHKALYYPLSHDPLEKEEVLNKYGNSLEREIQKIDFPNTWPALESILADNKNRLWVSTIVDNKDVYKWWVLDPSGEVLATFTWPRSQPIAVIKDSKIYVEKRDRKKGIKQVIRYDVEMKPAEI